MRVTLSLLLPVQGTGSFLKRKAINDDTCDNFQACLLVIGNLPIPFVNVSFQTCDSVS